MTQNIHCHSKREERGHGDEVLKLSKIDTPIRANSKICNAMSDFWAFRWLCHGHAIHFECCDWWECQATEDQALLFANHTADVNWCSKKIHHLCVSGTFPVCCYTCLQFTYLTPRPYLKRIVKSYDTPLESPGNYLVTFLPTFMIVQQVYALKEIKVTSVTVTLFPMWIARLSACQSLRCIV